MHNIYKDEKGHIVVETIGTFIPLVLLMISILSLVNIVAIQARMHYAITHAAKTISILSYSLKAFDKQESGTTLGSIDSVFNGINAVSGNNITNNNEGMSLIEELVDFGKSRLKGYVSGAFVRLLVERYLENDGVSGREYLKRFGIKDLDFSSSILIDENENVKLTVQYEVDYTFGALPLPFGPGLKVTQTVITKTWQSGSGDGYRW